VGRIENGRKEYPRPALAAQDGLCPEEISMLWLKAFHIVFVVTWFAGLFYLPRLFVYHVSASDEISLARFLTMERRLFVMMTIGATLAMLFGIAIVIAAPSLLEQRWLHAKLALVVALLGYHAWCYRLMSALRNGHDRHSQVWYRWFNEAPGLLLIAIVILVVVKPF
jgi:protoporphyrinogen IX oxidase